MMRPGLRKLTLTAHVVSSVGWLGAVVAYLALGIAGLTSADPQRIRAVYIAMELVGWWAIVPLSSASLLTGLIQSLGSVWGLFRHYWVLFKLLIAVLSIGFLLLHMRPTAYVANVAANAALSSGDLRGVRIQLVVDAGAAVLVLIVATVLSIYKPRGLTPYGWRREREQRPAAAAPLAQE